MREASKAQKRRLLDSRFATRFFIGHGIDIGAGDDALGKFSEQFPLMKNCRAWDVADGDAQLLASIADSSMDFVHSSHCLEHMRDPREALHNWLRVLKPGGHLIVIIPDEDLYEQGVFPSTFNIDHKWTFTLHKVDSWSAKSVNVMALLIEFTDIAQILKVEQLDATYHFGLPRFDQSLTSTGECSLEFILRKLPPDELARRGRFPDAVHDATAVENTFMIEPVFSMNSSTLENSTLNEASEIALLLYRAGHFSVAETIYKKILTVQPDSAEIYKNHGNTLLSLGRLEDAEKAYRRALVLRPDFGEAYNNLGNVLRLLNRLEESVQAFRQSLAIMPDRVEVHINFGNVLMELTQYKEAELSYRKAVVLRPDFAPAYNSRGNALLALERWQAAEKSYSHAITLKPDYAEAYSGLGNSFKKLLRFEAAEYAYRQAIVINPEDAIAKYNLSMLKLLQGEYEEGFRLYESRFDGADKSFFVDNIIALIRKQVSGYDIWHGEPLGEQTLSVITEQGAGDILMMMRYLTLIKEKGCKRLVVYCLPPMKRILQSIAAVDEVICEDGAMPCGLYCSLMSLPYLFNTRLGSIPCSIPYIHVADDMKQKWRLHFSQMTGKKVGLVWAGGKLTKSDKLRSIPLYKFASFLEIRGVHLVSLQKGEEAKKQLEALDWSFFDRMDECEDFLDTAALITELDLVISVDTSVAHLAGALGKPVWLLNRFESEWRWMRNRSDTPWYPSMTIFTQAEYGNWDNVICRVREELSKVVSN